jgi:hypothetical protein
MGIAGFLACAAIVIIGGFLVLLYFWSRSQESVSLKEYARIMQPAQAPQPNAGRPTAAVAYSAFAQPPKWQYKHKPVSRYNPQLGHTEQVMTLVLVYE